jgi:uncharacterized protein YqgC (DUF456 family)
MLFLPIDFRIALAVTIVLSILIIIPAQGTKKFGGSAYGVWGTNIGLLDICSNSFWVLIGPFFGSFDRRINL